MAESTGNKEMQSWAARLNTFQTAHQISKRRASSQNGKKKGGAGNTVEWPHERPTGEDLARAGFYYRPAQDSTDNVVCFLCNVKLDGWEPHDDPIKEHLAHSRNCHWATSLNAGFTAPSQDDAPDPMSDELVAARKGTFEATSTWPHENKRGWKCKIQKMVEAGWCFDPTPPAELDEEEGDGATCFYCDLSLDGWEPKDDPMEEHRRRSPDCAFFALVEKFGSAASKKATKGKGKKGAARTSAASTRLSTQSVLSTFSQDPSFADLGPVASQETEAEVDDSVVTTASQATVTGTTKGKKKGGKPKAPAKGAKGRKRANTVESEAEAEPVYPDLTSQGQSQAMQDEEQVEGPAPASKRARKGTRQSKQAQIDSSVVEVSSLDVAAPTKKATRGRKAKAQPAPEPEPEPEADVEDSDVSAQLQEELERSMSMDSQAEAEATPQSEPVKPIRGVKRTSEGVKKSQQQDSEVEAAVVEFPVPPKPAPAAKANKGRKPSKQAAAAADESESAISIQEDTQMSDAESKPAPKGKKGSTAKGKGKGRKASSTRSSRSSKAAVVEEPAEQDAQEEDLERDEREIEAELERIAAEQAAVQAEQERAAEFEASPSRKQEEEEEAAEEKLVEEVAGSPPQLSPVNLVTAANDVPVLSPGGGEESDKENVPVLSPGGGEESDKENVPVSSPGGGEESEKENVPSVTKPKQQQAPTITLSPSKRVPLAPGTPNRSPSKQVSTLSPSKRLPHLKTTHPWNPADLDALLLSPQATPNTLAAKLAGAAGGLASPEKGLTVEAWVRSQAARAEEELRVRCEEMVGGFEREGVRALGSLEGVEVVG